jgi:hypothetical protein
MTEQCYGFFFFFAYIDPLFIGGWKDIFQLVTSVNRKFLKVPPIHFSDPKAQFGEISGMGEIHSIREVV